MAPCADPRLGILADDVADRVHDELERMKKDDALPFAVLCACSRGEVSNAWEEQGQTAFGYYLDEGLAGAADGFGTDTKDRKVSVSELATFVQARVSTWARMARDVKQTPVLYGAGDFDVADTYDERPAKPTAQAPPDDYPKWLKDWWKQRDDAWDKGAYAYAGRLLREMDAILLQAERRLQGGYGEKQVQDDLSARLDKYPALLAALRDRLQRSAPPRSLAQLKIERDLKADAEAKDALSVALKHKGWADPALEKDLAAKKDPALDKFNDKPATPERQAAILEAFVDSLKSLVDSSKNPLTDPFGKPKVLRAVPLQLQFLGTVLERIKWEKETRLAEINYLDLLIRAELQTRWTTASQKQLSEAILNYLLTVQEAETVVAACGPRVLPWIQKRLSDADATRQQALALVLRTKAGGEGTVEDGHAAAIVKSTKEALDGYQKITPSLKAIADAYRADDEVIAILPQVMSYYEEHRENLDDPNSRWYQATSGWLQLHRALAWVPSSKNRQPTPDELTKIVQDIRLRDLLQPFDKTSFAALLARADSSTATDYRQLQWMLASPRWTADQRAKLWEATRRLGRKFSKDVTEAESESRGSGRTDARGEPSLEERNRAIRRGRLNLDLLKLSGYYEERKQDLQEIENEYSQAFSQREQSAEYVDTLGEKLRVVLGRALPEAFGKKLKDGTSDQADLLSRALYPLDFREVDAKDRSPYPALKLREAEIVEYWRAVAKRCDSEAAALPPANVVDMDYTAVVRRSLEDARDRCKQLARD